jgi:hypothetical protein
MVQKAGESPQRASGLRPNEKVALIVESEYQTVALLQAEALADFLGNRDLPFRGQGARRHASSLRSDSIPFWVRTAEHFYERRIVVRGHVLEADLAELEQLDVVADLLVWWRRWRRVTEATS